MTDADQLRQALDHLPAISGSASDRHSVPADRLLLVADAARSWLSLQEADKKTVEKVAAVLRPSDETYATSDPPELTERLRQNAEEASLRLAYRVLAAIVGETPK